MTRAAMESVSLGTSGRHRGWAAAVALSALIGVSAHAADPANLPIQSVRVDIDLSPDGQATVQEHYVFATPVRVDLQYLSDPCSEVGAISIASDTPVGFAATRKDPWVLLTTASRHDEDQGRAEYSVSYTVTLSGETMNVPLIMPSRPLVPPTGIDTGLVRLQVTFSDTDIGAAVVIPQMWQEETRSRWSATMIAIPSFVRLHPGAQTTTRACSAPGGTGGSSGSLEWWVLAFVLSMVAWVAFYMRWALSQ